MIVSARPDSLSGAADELHPFQCRAGCLLHLATREKLLLITAVTKNNEICIFFDQKKHTSKLG